MCRCHTGVGSNSIKCYGCKQWVHKKCSGLKRVKEDLNYRCSRCQGNAHPIDRKPQKDVQVGSDKLEVASFCYLGDILSAAGACELVMTTYVNTTSKKVKGAGCCPFFHPATSQYKTRGRGYSSCVRNVMLHASETCMALDKTRSPAFTMQ